jgi:exodeoxyribonuclease V beta subunit
VQVKDSEQSPLYRVLAGRRPDGSIEARPRRPKVTDVEQRLERLAASHPDCIAVEICTHTRTSQTPGTSRRSGAESPSQAVSDPYGANEASDKVPGSGEPDTSARLLAANLSRGLDLAWRRTSYSAILAGSPQPSVELVRSEPERGGILDEPETALAAPLSGGNTTEAAVTGDAIQHLRTHTLPLASMPGGADVGTFIHRLLELVDFASGHLRAHIQEIVQQEWARRPPSLDDPAVVVGGLEAAIRTPLGPSVGGDSLGGVSRADRLDEVAFELPLAGGDDPRGTVLTEQISRLFAAHLDPDGPLRGYAERLASPSLSADLRGYLTGSLDLVFRQRTGKAGHRFFVADYKTNRLAAAGEPLSAWHYRPEALDAAMQHAHYPLQAILYTVALHRYLRWRLPGYDPEQNLGGVLYLFLRGMTGPDCPVVGDQTCGVFAWKPPTALVVGLSELFDLPAAATPGDRL